MDGGTLSRVFGTLLTAMEERMKDVILIGTSNDIQALPPELIRRFNEVFFVGLPTEDERVEIFKIHLSKRGRDMKKLKIDIDELVKRTNDFTGSEIEKAVKESIARAFTAGHQEITQEDLLGAIDDTKPIAEIMKENIDQLKEWAKNRARFASSQAEKIALSKNIITTSTGRELDLADISNIDFSSRKSTPKN